jgi:hypothetical protein
MALINLRNALMSGKRKPTAKDYVQDGLVAMWDGIENAGWGIHNASATVWKDLIGSRDFALGGAFSAESLGFRIGDGAAGYGTAGSGYTPSDVDFLTTQLVVQVMENKNAFLATTVNKNTVGKTCTLWKSGSTYYLGTGWSSKPKYEIGSTVVGTYMLTIIYNGQTADGAWKNTTQLTQVRTEGFSNNGSSGITIGVRAGYTSWNANALYMGLRLYSRALTADEIAANYAIDKERFNLP